jgi:hypothetical protein
MPIALVAGGAVSSNPFFAHRADSSRGTRSEWPVHRAAKRKTLDVIMRDPQGEAEGGRTLSTIRVVGHAGETDA